MTRMSFGKFLLVWLLSSILYIAIGTYAGSISSIENPKPAILTAIGLSVVLWGAWFIYQRRIKKQ